MGSEAAVGVDGGAGEVIASLQEELALERAKNEILMEQVLEGEDALAGNDAEAFDDVIPNEDRDFWRGLLIENRTATINLLTRMRDHAAAPAQAAPAAVPAAAPVPAVPGGAVPAAAPKPLHNRAEAKAPVSPATAGQIPADRATRLRNRAQEIARREGCSFTNAFRKAEQELTV